MRSLIKRNDGVSEVVGYALSLVLMSILVASAYLMTDSAVNKKVEESALSQASNLADRVADAVINTLTIYQNNPSVGYSRDLVIPSKLAGKEYYIELTNNYIYVNTSDSLVSERSSLFKLPENNHINVDGKIYGSNEIIKISFSGSDYVYKFDFGPTNSTMPWHRNEGYTKVSTFTKKDLPLSLKNNWDKGPVEGWKYCTELNITNPTASDIDGFNGYSDGYPILVRLNPSNFDYSTANSNGSDLRFYGSNGATFGSLHHWIERWNSYNTSTSRIWVNVPSIPADGCKIYMFHGKNDAAPESNGENVFLFFDDFNDLTDWDTDTGGSLSDGLLVLDSSSAETIARVTSKTFENGVLEVKAKATGSGFRDASIFARNNSGYRYIFHNGNYTLPSCYTNFSQFDNADYNCSISKNFTHPYFPNPKNQVVRANDSHSTIMDTNWNRLVFILNDNDYVGARYRYDTFELDASAKWVDGDPSLEGSFGLINQNGSKSYFDWIFLRPFAGDTSVSPNADPEDEYPTAYVGGTTSFYYNWTDNTDLEEGSYPLSNDLNRDYIGSSTDSETFKISGLEANTKYSILYTVGDSLKDVTNMQITVDSTNYPVGTITAGNYSTDFITVESNSTGVIELTFESTTNDFWNICYMTVEKGERKIMLEGI